MAIQITIIFFLLIIIIVGGFILYIKVKKMGDEILATIQKFADDTTVQLEQVTTKLKSLETALANTTTVAQVKAILDPLYKQIDDVVPDVPEVPVP
jgi:hypothetical protein